MDHTLIKGEPKVEGVTVTLTPDEAAVVAAALGRVGSPSRHNADPPFHNDAAYRLYDILSDVARAHAPDTLDAARSWYEVTHNIKTDAAAWRRRDAGHSPLRPVA